MLLKKFNFCGCVLFLKLYMCNDSCFASILGQVILFGSFEKLSTLL